MATHRIGGHRVDVIDLVDDGDIGFALVLDGALLGDAADFDAPPDRATVVAVVRRWLDGRTLPGTD